LHASKKLLAQLSQNTGSRWQSAERRTKNAARRAKMRLADARLTGELQQAIL